MGPRPAWNLTLVAALVFGCAGGVDLDPLTGDQAAQGKADGVGLNGAEVSLPTLDKRYALVFESTIKTQDEGGDDPPKTVNTTILADVIASQDGERVTLSIQPCEVTLPELDGRLPEVAPDVIQSIEAVLVEGRIRPDTNANALPADSALPEAHSTTTDEEAAIGEQSNEPPTSSEGADHAEARPDTDPGADPAGVAFRLVTEKTAFVGGAHLDAPLTDPLPLDDDDPRLLDIDLDGRPGISIHIAGFRAYASFRLTFQMTGQVEEGAIEGESAFALDSQIVGDDIPFVDAAKRAREAAEDTVILSQEHRFKMTAMPAELSLCGFEL